MAACEQPILIAGGGIGGLAAALGLAQKGFRSILLEKAAALGEIGRKRQGQIPLADRVEKLGGMHHVVALAGRAPRCRAQRHLAEPKPFTRELPVIGHGEARGRLVLLVHLVQSPGGLEGAAAPVGAARDRDRLERVRVDVREVRQRGDGPSSSVSTVCISDMKLLPLP